MRASRLVDTALQTRQIRPRLAGDGTGDSETSPHYWPARGVARISPPHRDSLGLRVKLDNETLILTGLESLLTV